MGLSAKTGRELHQNRLLQLAREAGQTAVYQLKQYEPARRYGTLVALMIETGATLTDETLNLHDRLMGRLRHQVQKQIRTGICRTGQGHQR